MRQITKSQKLREEIIDLCSKHNSEKGIIQQFSDDKPLKIRVTFKNGSYWKKKFNKKTRTYEFTSDNKYFIPMMLGNSIYASCLNRKVDQCIRLDIVFWEWDIESYKVL